MTVEPSRRSGRLSLFRRTGFYTLTIGGTVANGIQVLGAGPATSGGLVIAGLIGAAALVPAVYEEGRKRGARSSGVGDSVHADLVMHSKELTALKSILDSTLGAYRPHREVRTIVFDIGEQPGDDLIEERRRTTPNRGAVVYWSQFEAIALGQHHILSWDDIGLRVGRVPEKDGDPQRAKVIPVRDWPVPRALILFAPPRPQVNWTANYRSPGYWTQLRETRLQRFTWAPPLVRPDENGGQRTPVQAVTFVFRVPVALGPLQWPPLPDGIAVVSDDHPQDGVRTYRVLIDDLNGFLAANPTANAAIEMFLMLNQGDAR